MADADTVPPVCLLCWPEGSPSPDPPRHQVCEACAKQDHPPGAIVLQPPAGKKHLRPALICRTCAAGGRALCMEGWPGMEACPRCHVAADQGPGEPSASNLPELGASLENVADWLEALAIPLSDPTTWRLWELGPPSLDEEEPVPGGRAIVAHAHKLLVALDQADAPAEPTWAMDLAGCAGHLRALLAWARRALAGNVATPPPELLDAERRAAATLLGELPSEQEDEAGGQSPVPSAPEPHARPALAPRAGFTPGGRPVQGLAPGANALLALLWDHDGPNDGVTVDEALAALYPDKKRKGALPALTQRVGRARKALDRLGLGLVLMRDGGRLSLGEPGP